MYAFDTGFVCYYRGWQELRPHDLGVLWEHFVLNELQAHLQSRELHYWRDKRQHEIDFVLARRGRPPLAIECKWSAGEFDTVNMQAFGKQYPRAKFYMVAHDIERSFVRDYDGLTVKFVGIAELLEEVLNLKKRGQ